MIETQDLSKQFHDFMAVDGVNLSGYLLHAKKPKEFKLDMATSYLKEQSILTPMVAHEQGRFVKAEMSCWSNILSIKQGHPPLRPLNHRCKSLI